MFDFLERPFIYRPMRWPEGEWLLLPESGEAENVREVSFLSGRFRLYAWHFFADSAKMSPSPRGVLLWLHGNAGNITHRYVLAQRLCRELGLDVLVFDYRGYGKSEGRPSENGIYADAEAAWGYLRENCEWTEKKIWLFGKSLGGAPAAYLAERYQPSGLILQSTFTSIPDMVPHTLPLVPRFLIRSRMETLARVKKITCPKLIIHGQRDEVIPYEMGERLFTAAAKPKIWLGIDAAGHNDLEFIAETRYYSTLRQFIKNKRGKIK